MFNTLKAVPQPNLDKQKEQQQLHESIIKLTTRFIIKFNMLSNQIIQTQQVILLTIFIKFYQNKLFLTPFSHMANTQNGNFNVASYQAKHKIQWGVSSPHNQFQVTGQNNINVSHQNNVPAAEPASTKARLQANGLSFQELPIKSSQIITTNHKKIMSNESNIKQIQYTQQSTENARDKVSRLNQLKSQFQILKGTLIDSRIIENQKAQHQKVSSNLSESNIRSSQGNLNLKTGQSIRAKQKGTKISKKESMSSISEKDLNLGKTNGPSSKQKRIGFEHIFKKGHLNLQNNRVSQSKMSRSKLSQHHSQNPKTERSKLTERLQKSIRPVINPNMAIEKHNLQVQLQNSLQKMQILIQSEILLKTRVHDLQQMIKRFLAEGSNKQDQSAERKIEELNKKLEETEGRFEQQREQNRQLMQRIGRLDADSVANEAIISLLKQEKNQELNKAMEMKLKFAHLQIDIKRLQMQKDMQKKDHQYQLEILRNQNQILRQSTSRNGQKQFVVPALPTISFDKQRIKMLQQELEQKDRKYKQALEDLQNKKLFREEKEMLEIIQKAHKKKQEQGQNQISRQLSRLKDQLVKMKNKSDLTQSQYGIQSKVISLEQALKRENEQKDKNVLEFQIFQRQFDDLKTKYKALVEEKQVNHEQSYRKISKLTADLQQLQSYKHKYEQVSKANEYLNIKITQLEILIKNYEETQHQASSLRETLNRKEANHNNELRDAKRRIDNAQFQAFKVQEQNKLSLDLTTRKLQSEIQILRNQLRSLQQDRNFHRDQMNNLKQHNQHLSLRIKQFQFHHENKIKYETHQQIEQKQRMRSQYNQQIDAVSKKFLAEQKRLVEQITGLTKLNEQLSQRLKKYIILESENYELRQLCHRKISSETSINHLWDIKQVQYSNINKILEIAKNEGMKFPLPVENLNLISSQLYTQIPEKRKVIYTNLPPMMQPMVPIVQPMMQPMMQPMGQPMIQQHQNQNMIIPQNGQQIIRVIQGQQVQGIPSMMPIPQPFEYRQGQPGMIVQGQNIQFIQPNKVMQPLQIIKQEHSRQKIQSNSNQVMTTLPKQLNS